MLWLAAEIVRLAWKRPDKCSSSQIVKNCNPWTHESDSFVRWVWCHNNGFVSTWWWRRWWCVVQDDCEMPSERSHWLLANPLYSDCPIGVTSRELACTSRRDGGRDIKSLIGWEGNKEKNGMSDYCGGLSGCDQITKARFSNNPQAVKGVRVPWIAQKVDYLPRWNRNAFR